MKQAVAKVRTRYKLIFQRRHDCIHNCDKPKIAIQSSQIQETFVDRVIQDVEFLVNRIHDDLKTEFPVYLSNLGFNSITRNVVGAN